VAFSHLGWRLRLRLELWTLQGQIAEALYQLPLLLTWSYGGMVDLQPLNIRFRHFLGIVYGFFGFILKILVLTNWHAGYHED